MIIGPPLYDNQYAVLMADGHTGHVLTTKGDIYFSDDKEVYIIFDNLEAARLFIKERQYKNNTLEFNVYNSDYEFVEHWEATKWKH
jgi:hypothetical protein